MTPSRTAAAAALGAVLLVVVPASAHRPATSSGRPVGDSSVVTTLPARPGYPENLAELDGRLYVTTGAKLQPDAPGQQVPSELEVLDERTGRLVQRVVVTPPEGGGALTGVVPDHKGNLYVSSAWGVIRLRPAELRGAVVLLTADDVRRHLYSPHVPTLPACPASAPCAPVRQSHGSLVNGMALGPDGALFLADSFQATIWRVPPGGGTARPWFQDARIDGPFAANGIKVAPSGRELWFTVSADWSGDGALYRLPLSAPSAANLRVVHDFGTRFPDDLAFGPSGRAYVALALGEAVAVLDEGGGETVFTGPARTAAVPVPYDMPSAIAFAGDGRRVFVTNHSEVAGIARDFVVFDLVVDDVAAAVHHSSTERGGGR